MGGGKLRGKLRETEGKAKGKLRGKLRASCGVPVSLCTSDNFEAGNPKPNSLNANGKNPYKLKLI